MSVVKRVKELVLVVLGRKEFGGRRLKSLDFLIRKEERLKAKHGGLPVCPYCKSKMLFRHSRLSGGSGAPLRDDQGWKCPVCKHTAHFGVPVTRKEFDGLRWERGGVFLSRPSFSLSEREDSEVKERLKKLGYLEFD